MKQSEIALIMASIPALFPFPMGGIGADPTRHIDEKWANERALERTAAQRPKAPGTATSARYKRGKRRF